MPKSKIFRVSIEWHDGTKTNLMPDSIIIDSAGHRLALDRVEAYCLNLENMWIRWDSLYSWESDADAEEWNKETLEDLPGHTSLRLDKIAAVHVIYEKEE